MTTEQETGGGAPGRRAVPKTGTRRSAAQPQSKPRPRPEARREAEAKRAAAERARAESAGERVRGSGVRGAEVRGSGERGAGTRARGAAGGQEAPAVERVRGRGTPAAERARGTATGKRPVGGRTRAGAGPGRATPRRGPARRQRAPFVLLVVGLLCGGLVSLLLLNVMLAQDASTDATLRKQIAEAQLENEQLDQRYLLKTQPENIAELAEKQGYGSDWDKVNSWSSAGDQASRVDTER
ncbi:hypothetical protein [Nonomuraea candida]|uniref:hypothetical protein n=1 Tax=Nonomuraea candida TaxID=359159 RepID=UPI0006942AEB|nr:hypothetical protein [Nonomuraea candida]